MERRWEKDKVIEGEIMGRGTIFGLQSEGNEFFAKNKKQGKGTCFYFFSQLRMKIKDVFFAKRWRCCVISTCLLTCFLIRAPRLWGT